MVDGLTFFHFSVCITLKEPEQKLWEAIKFRHKFRQKLIFGSFLPITFTSALLLNLIPCVVFLSSGHKWRLNEFIPFTMILKLNMRFFVCTESSFIDLNVAYSHPNNNNMCLVSL